MLLLELQIALPLRKKSLLVRLSVCFVLSAEFLHGNNSNGPHVKQPIQGTEQVV